MPPLVLLFSAAAPASHELGAVALSANLMLALGLIIGLLAGAGAALVFSKRSQTPNRSGALTAGDGPSPVIAAIADTNPDAVVLFNDGGQLRYANASARELFFE